MITSTNFFSYLMMTGSFLLALWCVRQIFHGYPQHFLLFICAVMKIVLEADWLIKQDYSELRIIAWNVIDIGYMLILYSYMKYGILTKNSRLRSQGVFLPFLRRPDLTAPAPNITPETLLKAIKNAQEKLQQEKKS